MAFFFRVGVEKIEKKAWRLNSATQAPGGRSDENQLRLLVFAAFPYLSIF